MTIPRSRTFGTAAVTARQQFAWLWTRESLLRLGLSLVLATALWLYVTTKQDPTLAFDYPQPLPVAPINVHSGLIVTNNLPSIRVRIRVANNAAPLPATSFHAFVDLSSIGAGDHPAVPVRVVPDPGIDILQIRPSTVAVVVEKQERKQLPVHVSALSPPPDGYAAGAVQADPGTVTVSGPQSIVSSLSQAAIYLYLSQDKSTIDGLYKPAPVNSRGDPPTDTSHLNVTPGQIHVHVPIKPLSSYKTVPVLVTSISGKPKAGLNVTQVSVNPAAITIRAPPSVLSRISSVSAKVSVAGRGRGRFRLRGALQLPSGVHSQSRSVIVSVQIGSVPTARSIGESIVPINVQSGLSAAMSPLTVVVTIEGSPAALRSAAPQLSTVVNLAGYTAGTYQLTPTVTAPPGVRVVNVYPSTVTVTLASSFSR